MDNNINIDVLFVGSANCTLTLHRLMADGQSATYILIEEKNEERRREGRETEAWQWGSEQEEICEANHSGVPKQKVNT